MVLCEQRLVFCDFFEYQYLIKGQQSQVPIEF